MKSYKIWILFILLSVFSFGEILFEDPKNNAIGVWVSSVNFELDPIVKQTGTLKLTFKSRTGEKFIPLATLELGNFEILGGTLDPLGDVTATKEEEDDVVENPKIITIWVAEVKIKLVPDAKTLTINGIIIVNTPDGNQNAINGKGITFGPFSIVPNNKTELRIHEKLSGVDDWENMTTSPESKGITDLIPIPKGIEVDVSGKKYIFTKGGQGSFEDDPGIYALISTGGEAEIKKLWVEKNGDGIDDGVSDSDNINILDIPSGEGVIAIKIGGFKSNEKNTVTVKPISEFGMEGSPVTLDFLIDTQINTLYLEDEIIGELKTDDNGEKKIFVKLSELKELSGVARYNYVFTVVEDTATGGEVTINGDSSSIPSPDSNLGTVEIPTSGFIGGSKGTLLFTVYDKLGHEKTFEKTYFIPDQSEIKATIEGEAKQRRSRVKLVSEGASDKFEVESSMDTSSE